MADYQAKINLVVASQAGEQRLNAVANQIARIQSLVNSLNKTPVELFSGGRGAQRDASGKLSAGLRDIIREFENGQRTLGKSVSSISRQIAAFNEILDQTEFKGGGFKNQDNSVKSLVKTLNKANTELTEQERKKLNILRVSQGLQTIEEREYQVARRRTLLASRRVNEERAVTRERQRQAELTAKTNRDKAFGKRAESIALGAGFPLLFGGGPGAVLGGALGGAFGGFGLQIITSAIGQVFDKFAQAALEAGKALRSPIKAFEELIRVGGLAGTSVARQVRVAEFLGVGELGAAGVSRAARINIGEENADALVSFATATERLSNTFAIFDSNLKALMARGLTPVTNALDEFLKGLTGLRGQVEFADVNKIRQLESIIATLEGDRASQASISLYREQLKVLQEQNAAAQKYKDIQDQIQEIAGRIVSNSQAEARYEQDRLNLTRLAAASRQGQLAVNQANLELDKLRARDVKELKEDERRILEILIKQAEARRDQAEAARENAVTEAYRQLRREELQRDGQILGLKEQTRDVVMNQARFEHGLLATFESQEEAIRRNYKDKRAALQVAREAELIGVNELDVQEDINRVYARRDLLLRKQEGFALRQLQAAAAARAINAAQVSSQLQQKQLEAAGAARSAIQAADPSAGFVPFYGGSAALQAQQLVDFNAELQNMNNQLRNTEDIINSVDFEKLEFSQRLDLKNQAEELRNNIALFEEYQPAINAANLAQQRFQDTMRFTQPVIQTVADTFVDFADKTVTGTEAALKALQNFGNVLLQEGVKMISMYIAIGVAKMFAGLSSGGGTPTSYSGETVSTNAFNAGGIPGISSTAGVSGGGFPTNAGVFSSPSFGVGGMANGGAVRSNTPYLVGERGPELFVPGMNGGVMSNSDLRSAMGAAPGTSGGTVLNMSFETTNIAGVEYVSREQLEAAMAATRRSAARDGAKQGMTMTLDRLQQSPSTRRRTGI